MTTEVSIMNTQAVALAADSAVTVTIGPNGAHKVYNSVNKLFALSKYEPVGIMIYGSASYMSIPWETIIKTYRKILSSTKRDKLEQYLADFLGHIKSLVEDSQDLNTIEAQYIEGFIRSFYVRLNDYFTEATSNLSHDQISKQLSELFDTSFEKAIDSIATSICTYDSLDSMESNNAVSKLDHNSVQVDHLIDGVFQNWKSFLNLERRQRIIKLCAEAAPKEPPYSGSESGIVIAGFGDKEIFPAQVETRIEGFLFGCLKHTPIQATNISEKNTASITPFAQGDVIASFMNGMASELYHAVGGLMSHFTENEVPDQLVKAMQEEALSPDVIDRINRKIKKAGIDFIETSQAYLADKMDNEHSGPIVSAVGFLPKEEIAQLAESLVNLTSVRRRMSTSSETVGGPVDVAIISKGDGFIWIKRKHYFEPELNNHFFSNYYRDE
ncbi:hypothetical protein [Neptunomonas marina]|uniref:Uncharacterized protein n=1 Tax=Neptunomonas marina TaxID=1815562 RepID=A0A437QDW4_9GAMM|nr:hypothetical protein [Neptunomonas marina]RVU32686.1 hypothetical protein EOE65_03260 [Neptunomonas marina]